MRKFLFPLNSGSLPLRFMPQSLFNVILKYLFLQEELEKKYLSYISKNESASEKKCQLVLTSLWQDIDQKIENYTTSGGGSGYAIYKDDVLKAETSYSKRVDLGPMKDKVLTEFLSSKRHQRNGIMKEDEVSVLRSNSM